MTRISLAPSVTLVTVSVSETKVCPASIVSAVTPENRSTAAPPSVKVGLTAVAVSVGSSLISAMLIVATAMLLVAAPSVTVTLIVRVVPGSSVPFEKVICSSIASYWAAVPVPVIVIVPVPEPVTTKPPCAPSDELRRPPPGR